MKFFIDEDETEEVPPIEETSDHAIVVNPTIGKRGEKEADIVKEIAALDALMIGPSEAARIHDIPQSSVSKYHDGKDIANDDVRARVLSKKLNIQDTAVVKLMETLNLLDASAMEKPSDKIKFLDSLSRVVEKMGDKRDSPTTNVQVVFYSPNQKKESDYTVIDA